MNDLDRRIGESLKSVSEALRAGRAERAVGAHADFRRRISRRRVTRFATTAAAAGVLGVAVAIAATQGTDLFDRTERESSVPAPLAGTYVQVGEDPVGVSVGGNTVWVASSSGTLTRVNASTKRSTAVIPIQGEPSDIALSAQKVWISDAAEGSVKAIDAATGKYVHAPISLGSQGRHIDIDAGPQGTVWAVSYDSGLLFAIDPATGEFQNSVPVGAPTELAIAPGTIWALVEDGSVLAKYDFASGDETLTVPVDDAEKTDMAATASAVYIAEADGSVLRIDASTGEIATRVTVGGRSPELAVGDGVLWVASDEEGTDAELAQLDLEDLGRAGKSRTFVGAPTDLALGDGAVWITDTGRETVVRVSIRR